MTAEVNAVNGHGKTVIALLPGDIIGAAQALVWSAVNAQLKPLSR